MTFRLPISLALLTILILAGCQPPDDDAIKAVDESLITLSLCTQEQFPHRGNRKDFQCGTLSVAENPDQVNGRKIDLNIVRLPALSHSPKPDPVFVLAGGPGQASTEIVNAVSPWMRLVNRERDFVFVDQRGTGKSNPLDCLGPDDIDFTLDYQQQVEQQKQSLKTCLQDYEADLPFYTTPYAADDIAAVSKALAYQQINLWGASYGTRFALEIMRRHSSLVRSAVLDSVAPVGINLPQYLLPDADKALQALIDVCHQQQACAERYPNLSEQTRQLIAQLDSEPRQLSVVHPLKGEPFEIYLDGQVFASLLRLGLYMRDLSPTIPLIIDSAINNNFTPLMTLLSLSEEVSGGISLGLQQTILCAEDVANIQQEVAIAEDSILQLKSLASVEEICEFWPQGKLPDDYFEPLSSDLPTLLLSGELDPVTPPRWGEKAAQTLSQHLHVVVAGAHHNVSHLGCTPELINNFYDSLKLENVDTSCTDNIKPLPAFISAAGPTMKAEDGASD